MAHISLPEGVAGISGPMLQYPETAQPLNALAEALLRGPSSLSPAEREVIATYVSSKNNCYFCTNCHAATARHLLKDQSAIMDEVLQEPASAHISDKMKALLVIAEKVQQGGRRVTDEDVASARAAGADDKAIHDTVLTAAAFCMFNRYVDGLATWAPEDSSLYDQIGERLATNGYPTGSEHRNQS